MKMIQEKGKDLRTTEKEERRLWWRVLKRKRKAGDKEEEVVKEIRQMIDQLKQEQRREGEEVKHENLYGHTRGSLRPQYI